MNDYALLRAGSLEQAVAALRADPQARPLAGGQSLLPTIRQRLALPSLLVDLGGLPALRTIGWSQAPPPPHACAGVPMLRIGAMVSHTQLAQSDLTRRHLPMLAALAEGIGDRQIRNRGTLGGSLANHDPAACHPAGALALGALIETDRRLIAADDFFTGLFGTALQADELVVAVHCPIPDRAAYLKAEQPASRFALVGVAVARFDSLTRVAVTGAAAGVFRAAEFERALDARFAPDALKGLSLASDNLLSDLHAGARYRAHLAGVLCARAVDLALAVAPTPITLE